MEIKGKKILHKKFGEGIIKALEEDRIRVEFGGRDRLFACSEAFIRMIRAEDGLISCLNDYIADVENRNTELKANRLAELEKQLRERQTDFAESKEINRDCYNIAVDAVYCDGGRSEDCVGFNGVCSDSVLEQNVNANDGRWCTKHECRCGVYAEERSTAVRRELDRLMEDGGFVCPESRMLRDWVISEGVDNDRLPRRLNIGEGKLCVLTTVEPGDEEENRYIFAMYIIDNIDEDINGVARVWADSRFKYAFTPKQAPKMKFWAFFAEEEESWGKDKFILLDDEVCITILEAALELTEDPSVKAMLACYRELNFG